MSDATYYPYVTDQEREDWNKAIAHTATARQLTSDETIETLTEVLKPCIDALAAEIQRIANILVEAFQPVVEALTEMARACVPAKWWHIYTLTEMARACVPAKWWHIYTHTKKARIRKKYRNRITRAVMEALAAAGGDEA